MEALLAPGLAWAAAVAAVAAVCFRADGLVLERLGRAASPGGGARVAGTFRRIGALGPARRVRNRDALALRLSLAGWQVSPDELVGGKIVAAAVASMLTLLTPSPGWLLAPVMALAGFRAPDVVVAVAARRRIDRADRELPLLLDVLAAASSAGLAGQLALRRAVSAVQGPLAEELGRALRSVDLGARWRDELGATADRLGLPDLRRAVAALTRTEALGASLAEQMTTLAAQVREARRAAVTERARKAPVKMLFPLVFLVLPAFLLLTVVPVLLTTLKSVR